MRRLFGGASLFNYRQWQSPNRLLIRKFAAEVSSYDVVVVGGGHAGCEAAAASARTGAKTLLVTHKANTIGACSCNPSIGGIGKGILVKEIDALDGLMGRVTDASGIFYRTLNRSRGPAVHGPRAQIDRELYLKHMQDAINSTPNLSVLEGSIEDLLIDETVEAGKEPVKTVSGVALSSGQRIATRHVVITTGTFLRAMLHFGLHIKEAGGRIGDQASNGLSLTFERAGLKLNRLTTATPPRLDGRIISLMNLITRISRIRQHDRLLGSGGAPGRQPARALQLLARHHRTGITVSRGP
jgi:tRNA uridine 5-carboxymethylaminomethyl modification enzyme